ncbi:MAG: ArsR/SmtB family transcription factor [Candidatus Kariarchaeaceae archaeon]|jgi:predicted transcriptional regulator
MKLELPFDEALELLSNSYRREILRLITIKERYAFELSKLLNISQRAVSNHLTVLKEANLVSSEKKKSDKGPDREYFFLNRSVILTLTVAPNLFLATLRDLDDNVSSPFASITPELQLGSPQHTTYDTVIEEGIELLPQIKEGLALLEVQQSKLLRAYQGLRNHIREILTENEFSSQEIRVLLLMVEHDGEMTTEQFIQALNVEETDIPSLVNSLIEKGVITSEMYRAVSGKMAYKFVLLQSDS